VVEEKKAHREEVAKDGKRNEKKKIGIEEMKEKIKELEKQWRDEIKRKIENDEGLTTEEMSEWWRIRKEEEIENIEKREASKKEDHKDNVAEEKEEGNKMRVDKGKEKGQKKETKDGEEEERGKREFWEMIKGQKEKKKQRRVEIRRKVMGNEELTKKKMRIWMEDKEKGEEEEL
jgi:hypothetical protein